MIKPYLSIYPWTSRVVKHYAVPPSLPLFLPDLAGTRILHAGVGTSSNLLSLASHYQHALIAAIEFNPLFGRDLEGLCDQIPNAVAESPDCHLREVDCVVALGCLGAHPVEAPMGSEEFNAKLETLVSYLKPGGFLVVFDTNFAISTSTARPTLLAFLESPPWLPVVPQFDPWGNRREPEQHFLFQKTNPKPNP